MVATGALKRGYNILTFDGPGQGGTPGSAIVLKETNGPVRYRFGKTVTYVTRSGKVLDEHTVKTRVKVGVPVRVHYLGTGEKKVVDRVILEQG